MRSPQNLKKSPTCFYSVASKQVGNFFKFLWPFQKKWTLSSAKGQIILECPFEILDFPKIPRKVLQISALESEK